MRGVHPVEKIHVFFLNRKFINKNVVMFQFHVGLPDGKVWCMSWNSLGCAGSHAVLISF